MERNRLFQTVFGCLIAAGMLCTSVASAVDSHTQEVLTSFLKHVDASDSIDATRKSEIKELIQSEFSSDALTDSLIKLYPEYSEAVESSDDENLNQAIKLLGPLADSDDKFLAADASFYLARAMMNDERFEDAMPRLEQLIGKMGSHSVHQGSAQYFKGVAQAGLLKNQDAIQSFMEFISKNPDAAERLRVSAWRQVQQLQAIQEGKLDDVHQRMDYSRRRLTQIETGEKTQEEQDKIVGMLTKLIKEAEKKECSSNCKKGGT